MFRTYEVAPEIEIIATDFPIPGFGVVAINAFVIKGAEPLLVDTGAVVLGEPFMAALSSVIDPADLCWIWLTHPDFDHIGSLGRLLADNPRIKVITTFHGLGYMSLFAPLPLDRIRLVNPGQRITIGERTLTALVPPTFDNPCTTGFFDETANVLFPSDCFGALLSSLPESAADLTEKELTEGQVLWATLDAPWVHEVDVPTFQRALDHIQELQPTLVLSSHLPPAPGRLIGRMLASLDTARTARPFVGPDQEAFAEMLRAMTAGPPSPELAGVRGEMGEVHAPGA